MLARKNRMRQTNFMKEFGVKRKKQEKDWN